MQRCTKARGARILLACGALLCLATDPSQVMAGAPGRDEQGTAELPGIPDRLAGDPHETGLLMVEVLIRVPGGRYWLEAASVMREGGGGKRIRAAALERTNRSGLVLFAGLEPGTYRIEFLEGSGGGGGAMRISVPVSPKFVVEVAPGSIHYVGRIEAKKRFRSDIVDVLLGYEVKRETAAWVDFARRYENSLWASRAAARIADLKSGDSGDSSE